MERKIGEIFEYNGEWYQAVYNTNSIMCSGCTFVNECNECVAGYNIVGSCGLMDDNPLIFKKLEKVGEPILYGLRLTQRYKVSIPVEMPKDPSAPCISYNFIDNLLYIEIKQTKEDMEEKNYATKHSNSEKIGKNLRPFDLQKAREGKPVCTRDGKKARIICFDRVTNSTNEYTGHLIVLVTNPNGDEQSFYYTEKGNLAGEDEYDNHKYDLMMLPEKKEGWVNVYKSLAYSTKEGAMKYRNKGNDYIDTIKVEWEE